MEQTTGYRYTDVLCFVCKLRFGFQQLVAALVRLLVNFPAFEITTTPFDGG